MRPDNLLKNRDGISPIVGVLLMVVIVIIMSAVVATCFLGEEEKERLSHAPFVSLTVSEYNNTTLRIEHNGGDSIQFNNSAVKVILNLNETDYLLNTSSLVSLEVGDERLLPLIDSEENLIPINIGETGTFKIVDLSTKEQIFSKEIMFTDVSASAG